MISFFYSRVVCWEEFKEDAARTIQRNDGQDETQNTKTTE